MEAREAAGRIQEPKSTSSILECRTLTFVRLSLFVTFNKKEDFFELLSTKITFFCGAFIAIGMPGKPPPLPRSTKTPPRCSNTDKESSMWSFILFVWFLDMRLWVLFQKSNSSIYFLILSESFNLLFVFFPFLGGPSKGKWRRALRLAALTPLLDFGVWLRIVFVLLR